MIFEKRATGRGKLVMLAIAGYAVYSATRPKGGPANAPQPQNQPRLASAPWWNPAAINGNLPSDTPFFPKLPYSLGMQGPGT